MDNNRNTFLAIALSILVIVVWQFAYVSPRMEAERKAAEIERQQAQQAQQLDTGQSGQPGDIPSPSGNGDIPAASPGASQTAPGSGDIPGSAQLARESALAETPRIEIENSHLTGSINLRGGRIDDLQLKEYRVENKPNSPLVTLFAPSQSEHGYFAELGWVGSASSGEVPGSETVWSAPQGARLTATSPVKLEWTSPAGVTFTREIAVDDNYLFTITDGVSNGADQPIALSPYGRVTRFGRPPSQGNFVLHEGMIGVFGEEGLQQYSYGDIEDDREYTVATVPDGWLGITDKYWASALVPQGAFKPRYSYFTNGRPRYQADFLGDPLTVNAGSSASVTQMIFAGAKEVDLIDAYEEQRNIPQFELLIDWGWFYFLTKPTFYLLDWLYRLVGNFGVAILIGTVLIKAALFPLANMSYKSMARMKKLQPEMTAMRERYGDDKVKMQQEMMALYKKEKINPAAGCWPVLIQIPIFFALYKVLYITIEMRHAPFFGWIQDLAAPDPTSIFNLFGLLPYDVPQFLLIGVFPLIMGFTMFLQMQMNPAPPDPTQAMIFKWMPVVFTFMLATFPAGLVIYWAWNNTLSIIQQGVIMKRQGVKIELWDNLKGMFRRKVKPAE